MQTLKTTVPGWPEGIRLIPVPSEKLEGKKSEYDIIQDEQGSRYEIMQCYTFERDEPFPAGLLLLATGQVYGSSAIWQKYSKSDFMYFFICKKLEK